MSDYLPLFKPGEAFTSQVSAAVTGGQVLEVTGNGTVGPAGAASTKVIGVAAFDAATVGDKVTVYSYGVQRAAAAAGGVTAGDALSAGAAGTVAPIGAGAFATKIGIALNTAAAAALVEVLMFA